jgi:hypothetical protein
VPDHDMCGNYVIQVVHGKTFQIYSIWIMAY